MNRKDAEKKIMQAAAERKRLLDGVKAQKKEAEARKEELSSLLQNMDPAASYEDFKKIQTEAATNDAFIEHLDYAEKQLKQPTEAARKEYAEIIDVLQADTNARHSKAGAAILSHLTEIEKIINETVKEDNVTRGLVTNAAAAYAMPAAAKKVLYSELGAEYPITSLSRLAVILQKKKEIEEERKKGKAF